MVSLSNNNLSSLAKDLRNNNLSLMNYLKELEITFKFLEPRINAFVPENKRFKRIRRDAELLLSRYPDISHRPLLFGIPIGVKDIFHISEFETKAGSQLPSRILKGNEAECITRLKELGVLILGKTITTEFAYFEPGPTRNPHDLNYTPGGSSSGSAAAVAAGLTPLALGTQTIGSIIRPASFCGVIGFKPSFDRISKKGVIPVSPSLDHVGFFVNDIEGAKLIASLLLTRWKSKVYCTKPVLGIPEGPLLKYTSKKGILHFDNICEHLIENGFEIERIRIMPDFREICKKHNLIMAAEFSKAHLKWFGNFSALYRPRTKELIKKGKLIPKKCLIKTLENRSKLRNKLIDTMESNDIDLWISPAAIGPATKGLESTGDPIMNLPWSHSGLPTINIPAGLSKNGLPMGLQVVAKWYSDEALLSWSYFIDKSLISFRKLK